jgi:pyruvate,orthophosphate dikinase
MDTVLNLGLNDRSVLGLAEKTGNEWFAWDSYRRFVQMFGNVCHGVPGEKIEEAIKEQKAKAGVELDTELSVDDLKALVGQFKELYREQTGEDFPQSPPVQLRQAIMRSGICSSHALAVSAKCSDRLRMMSRSSSAPPSWHVRR